MERDPVCGMQVDPLKAAARVEHAGHTYVFCCLSCAQKFQAAPDKYLQPQSVKPASPFVVLGQPPVATIAAPPVAVPAADSSVEYTCPMHPEVTAPGPGDCPICGMALEPRVITAEESPNEELVSMTRRFWTSVALTAPLLLIAMSEMAGSHAGFALLPMRMRAWVELLLATPVVLWCGLPFFERGWKSIVLRQLNMFTLIAVGTGSAYAYSVMATILPQMFPAAFERPAVRYLFILKPPPLSPRSFCLARCSNYARAVAPRPRFAAFWDLRRKRPGVSRQMVRNKTCRFSM